MKKMRDCGWTVEVTKLPKKVWIYAIRILIMKRITTRIWIKAPIPIWKNGFIAFLGKIFLDKNLCGQRARTKLEPAYLLHSLFCLPWIALVKLCKLLWGFYKVPCLVPNWVRVVTFPTYAILEGSTYNLTS